MCSDISNFGSNPLESPTLPGAVGCIRHNIWESHVIQNRQTDRQTAIPQSVDIQLTRPAFVVENDFSVNFVKILLK